MVCVPMSARRVTLTTDKTFLAKALNPEAALQASEHFRPYLYRAVVKRVIDGDSIVLDIDQGFGDWKHDQTIRVLGVNAPELKTGTVASRAYGAASKFALADRLPPGARVVLGTVKDRAGKFGRWLGVLWDESTGECINEWLVVNGYAEVKRY